MATLNEKTEVPTGMGYINSPMESSDPDLLKLLRNATRRIVNEWELEEQKIRNGKSDEAREIREFMERYVADQHREGMERRRYNGYQFLTQEIGSGKELKIPTLEEHFLDWMVMKKEMVSESTYKLYGQL